MGSRAESTGSTRARYWIGRRETPFGFKRIFRSSRSQADWSLSMSKVSIASVVGVLLLSSAVPGSAAVADDYASLVALFEEWREFEAPALVDGVPDYSAEAMAKQRKALPGYQDRLAAIDTAEWPVPQQIDWHLLRAEMSGLDFDHRVRKPWANNPAFYVMMFTLPST